MLSTDPDTAPFKPLGVCGGDAVEFDRENSVRSRRAWLTVAAFVGEGDVVGVTDDVDADVDSSPRVKLGPNNGDVRGDAVEARAGSGDSQWSLLSLCSGLVLIGAELLV